MPEHRSPQDVAQSDFLNDWGMSVEARRGGRVPGAWRTPALPAAIAGIAFAVLYLLAFFLLRNTPLGNATDAELVDYYADGNLTLTLAGMFAMPFAGIAFVYFMVLLRTTAGATGYAFSRVLGTVQIVVGAIFVAVLFAGTAALVATPANLEFADAKTDPVAARALMFFATTILLMFGMRMASMFVFASSSIGRATGLIPGWFGYLGYAVGVALLLSLYWTWFVVVFPLWVLVLCIIILWRRAQSPAG